MFVENASKTYRYGFNGKELDTEGMGGGLSTYDYGFRIYNPAIARFLSVDPLTSSYPWYTPYQFAGNKPIWMIDLDGLEETESGSNSSSKPDIKSIKSQLEQLKKEIEGSAAEIKRLETSLATDLEQEADFETESWALGIIFDRAKGAAGKVLNEVMGEMMEAEKEYLDDRIEDALTFLKLEYINYGILKETELQVNEELWVANEWYKNFDDAIKSGDSDINATTKANLWKSNFESQANYHIYGISDSNTNEIIGVSYSCQPISVVNEKLISDRAMWQMKYVYQYVSFTPGIQLEYNIWEADIKGKAKAEIIADSYIKALKPSSQVIIRK